MPFPNGRARINIKGIQVNIEVSSRAVHVHTLQSAVTDVATLTLELSKKYSFGLVTPMKG